MVRGRTFSPLLTCLGQSDLGGSANQYLYSLRIEPALEGVATFQKNGMEALHDLAQAFYIRDALNQKALSWDEAMVPCEGDAIPLGSLDAMSTLTLSARCFIDDI